MKNVVILIFFLFMGYHTIAQEFAPKGAEWFYNTHHGIFHATVANDTVINGTKARIIDYAPYIEPPWDGYGFWLSDIPNLYVYNTGDTVFVYNSFFKKFTPLYVFNVNSGDTICLPVLPPNLGSFNTGWSDSTFCIVVDSVKVVLYDNTNLKTVYTHSIAVPGKMELRLDEYARSLGNIKTGLLPTCVNCAYTLSDNYDAPWDIRCYHDSSANIKLVTGDCANGIKLSAGPISKQQQEVKLFPNPAKDKISISMSGPVENLVAELQDINGRKIYTMSCDNANGIYFDLSALDAGLYIIKLYDNKGYSRILKFAHVK